MLFSLAFRNALRNIRRSSLTSMTVALGCGLLIIGLAWLTGIQGSLINSSIDSAGLVRVVTSEYEKREALLPIEENIPVSDALISELKKIKGADHIYPKISQGVTASKNGEEIGEVFGLMIGAPIEYYSQILELPDRLSSGSFFTNNGAKQVILGKALAESMAISVGEEAIFLGQTQDGSISPIKANVQGIADTGNGVFDRQAYVSIESSRWMSDIPDGCTELLIYSDSNTKATTLANRIQDELPKLHELAGIIEENGEYQKLRIQSWQNREPFSSTLKIATLINGIMASIIVFITALGVLNTMMMSVLERTTEIGVLRALGMKGKTVAILFIFESILISTFGGVVGVFFGSVIAIWMQNHGIDLGDISSNISNSMPVNTTLYPNWSMSLALQTFGLGMLMALIGATLPSVRAIQISPVEAMKAKR